MLKSLYVVAAWLSVALGVVHVLFTACAYGGEFSLDAFWFAGSGFAIIFAGFLNLVSGRGAGTDRLARVLCHIANVLCVSLFAVGVFLIGEPQVYVGLLLFAFETLAAFVLDGVVSRERGEIT